MNKKVMATRRYAGFLLAAFAALAVVPAVSAAEACADSMVCKLNTLCFTCITTVSVAGCIIC